MKCVRGRLFTVDGAVEDEGEVSRMILEEVSGCLSSGISKAVTNLLAALKLTAYSPPLPIETDRIHVANGTYFLNGSFTEDKAWCNNRLKVRYEPNAPKPERWLGFLSELLEPEDIPTLQEYLGYCLIPSTKGQKMLLLIGKGGEGKSRIGLVMRSLLGDSMNMTSIQKVENNRFSRADLENKLLMVDDDMDMAALPKTNYIKSVDDPFLAEKLPDEAEGIFLWCLEGLNRLLANNYQFSLSGKARENVETVKRSSNNVIEFLRSEGYIRFRADAEASSRALYEAYKLWCEDNVRKPLSANRLSSELAQNEALYKVEATNNISMQYCVLQNTRARAFMTSRPTMRGGRRSTRATRTSTRGAAG